MYGASLTKTTVAYLVLMLVDEGCLDLDATVAQLVPRPLPEYEEFAEIARLVLGETAMPWYWEYHS